MKYSLDADVLIGALDRSDERHVRARRLFSDWHERSDTVVISVINLSEVLVAPSADLQRLGVAREASRRSGCRSTHQPRPWAWTPPVCEGSIVAEGIPAAERSETAGAYLIGSPLLGASPAQKSVKSAGGGASSSIASPVRGWTKRSRHAWSIGRGGSASRGRP